MIHKGFLKVDLQYGLNKGDFVELYIYNELYYIMSATRNISIRVPKEKIENIVVLSDSKLAERLYSR